MFFKTCLIWIIYFSNLLNTFFTSLLTHIFSFFKVLPTINNFLSSSNNKLLKSLKNNDSVGNYIFFYSKEKTNTKSYIGSLLPTTLNLTKFNLYDNFTIGMWWRCLVTESTLFFNKLYYVLRSFYLKSFSFGFYYIQGFFFILFIDACLTDDEPLWEPIEWSLVQTWILFIFIFGWIAENLIVSRYGSYTGRDKRVWMAWYKSFWLMFIYFMVNFAVTACFVIVPFYFELNYSLSFVYSWWNWYTRVFFFKFISLYTLILLIAYSLQIGVRWLNWKKSMILILLINIFLSYLIYTNFFMAFFAYFTDPVWYQKSRPVDYIQLSHEPNRWGWGPAKKDHFTYHSVKTVFWFKNDGPFAASFLIFHMFIFLIMFTVYIYWITLFRRVYSMKEVPITYLTYCISSLKQFFYCFLAMYSFIFLSYIINYWRLPIELFWGLDNTLWVENFYSILVGYPEFIASIFL